MGSKKEFRTTINLPLETGKLIKAIAKEQDRSTASLLRIIVTNYIKSYEIEVLDEITDNEENIYEQNLNKKNEIILTDEKIIRPPSKIKFSGFGLNKR